MSHGMGLYYPYIHFRDDRWTRVAALYWSRIARIKPPGYSTRDSEDVKQLDGELGIILNVSPTGSSKVAVGQEFADLVSTEGAALERRYGVSMRHSWPAIVPSERAAEPMGDEAGLAWVHVEKMENELRTALVESGLGLPSRNGDPLWIGVHPRMAEVYMSALAEAVGRANMLSPVTDQPLQFLASGGWPVSRLARAFLDEEQQPRDTQNSDSLVDRLAIMAIEYALPKISPVFLSRRLLRFAKRVSRNTAHSCLP